MEPDEFLPPSEFAAKLRNNPTPAEGALWLILREPRFGAFRFRRQHQVGTYFADVAAPAIKLAIEVDGDSHVRRPEEDEARDEAFKEKGWLVLRFRNEQVLDGAESVAQTILCACEARPRWRY